MLCKDLLPVYQIKQKVKKSRSDVQFKIKIINRSKCFKHALSKMGKRTKIEDKIKAIKQKVKKLGSNVQFKRKIMNRIRRFKHSPFQKNKRKKMKERIKEGKTIIDSLLLIIDDIIEVSKTKNKETDSKSISKILHEIYETRLRNKYVEENKYGRKSNDSHYVDWNHIKYPIISKLLLCLIGLTRIPSVFGSDNLWESNLGDV